MNRLKIISLVGLALLDLAAGLFAWRSFNVGRVGDSVPGRSPAMVDAAALSDVPVAALGDDVETLARPLFVKSRRPWQATPKAASEAVHAPPPVGLKLHAIVGFDHSIRAFVTSSAAADGKWLSVGETFENWTVDSITHQEIALRQDADLLRVGLAYDDVAAPVSAISVSPPARGENRDDAQPAKVVAPDALSAVRDGKRGAR